MDRMPRLSLSKVPEKTYLYPQWREEVESAILASGIGARTARIYVGQMNNWTHEALIMVPDDENYANLDVVLYNEIIKAMKSTRFATDIQTFTSTMPSGSGRAAFRQLDHLQRFELRFMAIRSKSNMEVRKCKEG